MSHEHPSMDISEHSHYCHCGEHKSFTDIYIGLNRLLFVSNIHSYC